MLFRQTFVGISTRLCPVPAAIQSQAKELIVKLARRAAGADTDFWHQPIGFLSALAGIEKTHLPTGMAEVFCYAAFSGARVGLQLPCLGIRKYQQDQALENFTFVGRCRAYSWPWLGQSMVSDEPSGWRCLWEKAQRERDPEKLAALIDQMNRLLTAHEKAAAERERPTARSSRKRRKH